MSVKIEPEGKMEIWNFLQDLRNDCYQPLSFVIGYAELLKQSALDDQREDIEMIHMYAYRSVEMIQKYVAAGFAYFVEGEKQFHKTDLNEIIESVVLHLNRAFGLHQISVTLPKQLPSIASCGFLVTVFTCLRCFEAAETMEIRGEVDEAETAVNIQIELPPQKYLRDYPGSDLDLAKQILKHHNSELKVLEENEKTIFRFALPLWQDE